MTQKPLNPAIRRLKRERDTSDLLDNVKKTKLGESLQVAAAFDSLEIELKTSADENASSHNEDEDDDKTVEKRRVVRGRRSRKGKSASSKAKTDEGDQHTTTKPSKKGEK